MQQLEEKFAAAVATVVIGDGNPAPLIVLGKSDGEEHIGFLLLELKKWWIALAKMVFDYNLEDNAVKLLGQKVSDKSSQAEQGDYFVWKSDHERAREELRSCSNLFWQKVRDSFPEIDLSGKKIGLRTDWAVVIVPEKPVESFLSESS